MGISGFEAFVMSTVSPFLLGIGPLRTLVLNNLRTVHLLSLAGVASYLIVDPVARLVAVGLGVSLSCLGWAGTLYSNSVNEVRSESKIMGWLLGLILSSTAKYAFYTNNPIWPVMHGPNGGLNIPGFILGLIAAYRFGRQAPLITQPAKDEHKAGSGFLAACGIGGIFFGLHSLLSDTSTMILWVWEGYPIRGPVSAIHGYITVAAMSVGLVLGFFKPGIGGSYILFIGGTAGAAVLTFYSHWTGYYGGVALAVYLMSAAVPLISTAAKRTPGNHLWPRVLDL